MKYRLVEWEENGYHDSYGYIAFYDAETGKIERRSHWATAWAGGADTSDLLVPTVEIVEAACEALAKRYLRIARRSILRDHFCPSGKNLAEGTAVVFKKAFNGRKQGRVAKGAKGTVARVCIDGFRSRYNTTYYRVQVRLENGSTVWVDPDKLARAGRPESRRVTFERCRRSAKGCDFRSLWFGGWDDTNWAKQALVDAGLAAYRYGNFTLIDGAGAAA